MIAEKYSFYVKKGEYLVRKVYVFEEDGKYYAEYTSDPRVDPKAYPYPCNKSYFDTREEAQEYIKTLIPGDDEINKVISYLNSLTSDQFSKVYDRLDYGIDFPMEEEDLDNRFMNCASDLVGPTRLLLRGLIPLEGMTVRISDISSVKWGGDRIFGMDDSMNSCEVILMDGKKLKPSSLIECWAICVLFDHNYSNRLFPDIHCNFTSSCISKYEKDGRQD